MIRVPCDIDQLNRCTIIYLEAASDVNDIVFQIIIMQTAHFCFATSISIATCISDDLNICSISYDENN